MSESLTYALDKLRDLGADLRLVTSSFQGTAARVQYSLADLGHPAVVDALDDFRGSWDDKREVLAKSLTSLADMAEKSADTFQGVDDDLAQKIADAMDSTP